MVVVVVVVVVQSISSDLQVDEDVEVQRLVILLPSREEDDKIGRDMNSPPSGMTWCLKDEDERTEI
jgi:hypothetical protein